MYVLHVFEELWIETLCFELRWRNKQALYTAIQKPNNLFAFIWVGGWRKHLKSCGERSAYYMSEKEAAT